MFNLKGEHHIMTVDITFKITEVKKSVNHLYLNFVLF